jgi:hypothetical protein
VPTFMTASLKINHLRFLSPLNCESSASRFHRLGVPKCIGVLSEFWQRGLFWGVQAKAGFDSEGLIWAACCQTENTAVRLAWRAIQHLLQWLLSIKPF